MTSGELNGCLSELSDRGDLGPSGLAGSGKAIPYYGWFWRTVDFDSRIRLAYTRHQGRDVPSWVGFCAKNKWGYPEFTATLEQSSEIRRLCEWFAAVPTRQTATAVYDYLQTLRPS